MSISMRTVNKRRKSLMGQYNYSGTPMRISNYQNNLN